MIYAINRREKNPQKTNNGKCFSLSTAGACMNFMRLIIGKSISISLDFSFLRSLFLFLDFFIFNFRFKKLSTYFFFPLFAGYFFFLSTKSVLVIETQTTKFSTAVCWRCERHYSKRLFGPFINDCDMYPSKPVGTFSNLPSIVWNSKLKHSHYFTHY